MIEPFWENSYSFYYYLYYDYYILKKNSVTDVRLDPKYASGNTKKCCEGLLNLFMAILLKLPPLTFACSKLSNRNTRKSVKYVQS